MTDGAELTRIRDEIHDQLFDLDRLVHDAEAAELRLTIYPRVWSGRVIKTSRSPDEKELPPPINDLVVRNDATAEIRDQAGIGWFDVESLVSDEDADELRLRSNFPLEISIHVRELDVELARNEPDQPPC